MALEMALARAAVSDQWGGPSSHAKADSLRLSLHSQLTAAKGVPDVFYSRPG
jgi:hypothetical protein